MFDIAFSELVVIAVVALIVIGPEKLPKVARTLGALVGRVQRYVATVKRDLEQELQLDDLNKLQQELRQGAHRFKSEVENSIQAEMFSIEHAADDSAGQPQQPEDAPKTEQSRSDGS